MAHSNAASRHAFSAWMWVAVAVIGTLYIGSTILTPLYPLYREEFGFDELVVSEIYAVYVIGNLAVLFWFGRLSDQLGRRRTVLIALGLTLVSMLVFVFARGTPWLFAARIVNGFAAGLGAGAVTAWIAELEPSRDQARAAAVASSGNLAGLALGGAIAGLLAQYGPWPLRTSFVLFGVVLLAMVGAVLPAPETVRHQVQDVHRLNLKPRLGVPAGIRMAFVSPAAMAFASFALGGFYGALIPGLVTTALDISNVAVVGGITGGFFAVAALTAAATHKLRARAAMLSALPLMLAGLGLLVASEALQSMPVLIAAALAGGAGMALGYRSSLQTVNEIAPGDRRAEVVSTFLLVCYLGNSLPVVGVGVLAAATSPALAHRVFAGVLAALACAACVVGLRYVKKR
jgi:predicted MFS family arabinose efflux permease